MKASNETVMAFIKEVYPEYTELAMAVNTEEQCLKDATELIRELRASQPSADAADGVAPIEEAK